MSKKNIILKDNALNDALLNQGYITGHFIPENIMKSLIDFYGKHQPCDINGFHTTHFSTDSDYKKKVNDGLIDILRPVFDTYLNGISPIFANFMIKKGNGNNHMPLHADWTYVQEPENMSISMWIPLVDTNSQNGGLGVIPFSQHISKNIRGPRITQVLPPYDAMLIKETGKLLNLNAGEAIIYDHRLLHYSPPNQTPSVRPAINISLAPDNAQIIHYTNPQGLEKIHKYEVDSLEFFTHYDNFQIPKKGILMEYKDPAEVPLIHDNVMDFINTHKKSFLQKTIDFIKKK